MNTRTLAAGTALAATLQLTTVNADADKVWLESDSTVVKNLPSLQVIEQCVLPR